MRGFCTIYVLLLVGTGCGGECQDGTFRFHDTCVAVDPFDKTPPQIHVDPPIRTRAVGNITLTTDEPAEIYVTVGEAPVSLDSQHEPDELVIPNHADDVVVHVFAVDLNGNQSAEQTLIWDVDTRGPAPPHDFALSRSGASRTVSWTPPQNEPRFGGVIVARIEGRLTSQPSDAVAYKTGDLIGPGVTVVDAIGPDLAAGTFTETGSVTPGLVRYAAWSFDDLLNYSAPASDFDVIAIGPQTATVSAGTGNTFSVTTPPSNLTLSGTTSYNSGAQQLTVQMTLRNDTTRVIDAAKILVTSTLPNGVGIDVTDGTLTTFPFRSYGAALLPAATKTVSWQFDGVTPGTTLVLDLEIRDNQLLMTQSNNKVDAGSVTDFVAGNEVAHLGGGPSGSAGGFGPVGGGFTPDGVAVFGTRSSGSLISFDLSTGGRVLSTTLTTEKAHIPQMILDPSGSTGYALLAADHLRNAYDNNNAPETVLVQFDAATLREHNRIPIGKSRNRDLRISADNKLLLIATEQNTGGVIVIDLATFTIAKRLITTTRPFSAVFGSGKVVAVLGANDVTLFDVTTGLATKAFDLPASSGRAFRLAFNGDNELWVGRKNNVIKLDLSVSPPTSQVFAINTRLMEVFDGKIYTGNGGLDRRATDGTQEIGFSTSQRGHWLGRSLF